jgi:2-dehydro-3-deoxyphosphogluconate aldolase/(4S)-4-hydroxy-2-oxoglutarate aldolase
MGTICTADQAKAAIDAGARFLVTSGVRAEVAKAGSDGDIR